ncbi:MAG TPA: membrane dipeptidase [Solirubrobacterales bacterium]|nr:membrane dipeptidase [Solirubrobacterales bacterium]
MIADMHCHYPMHLVAEDPRLILDRMEGRSQRPHWVDWLRARVVKLAAKRINYADGWRVSLDGLEEGDVRAVYSVLYEPFAEIDLDNRYGSPPQDSYYEDLLGRIDGVARDLSFQDRDNERHRIVTTAADLRRTLDEGKVAFMHCVEGGFHLGPDVEKIPERVAELKSRGVVYITVAHLFWRRVATNAPALPFLPDWLYRRVFSQPAEGLTELGRAIVEAMYRERMLIDLSHMSERALHETLDLLDRLDEGRDPTEHPVVATHAGYRLGGQEYMLSPRAIERIAKRGGVIGLIFAQHQLYEKAEVKKPDELAGAIEALCTHIERIRDRVPGKSLDHVAIGSDLDGFIEPTLGGIATARDLRDLVEPLEDRFGAEAEKFFSGNAIRVAETALG